MVTVENKPTVLVVDDHRFSRTVLTRILHAAGYRVEVAENGPEALEHVRACEPDAFILDAEMPQMNGIELCWQLREDSRFRTTPILIATANEDRYLLRSAFTAGCDDFLVKPLEPLVVVARLGGLIKKADYFKQLERFRAELARYVSPRIRTLVERRIGDQGELPPPALSEVCILFSDIRGFTALSRNIEPQALFGAISEHLGAQVDSVYRHQGYVDKFGGDGLMAIFDGEGMAENACRCALEMIDRVGSLNPPVRDKPVPLGIGIHAGPVVIGNIGTGEHLDYTAIGETVNVAARLCGHADPMEIVVSQVVRGLTGKAEGLAFDEGHSAEIRGLAEPVMLYHLSRAGAASTGRSRRGVSD